MSDIRRHQSRAIGFRPVNPTIYRLYNIAIASFLLLATLPILLLLTFLVLVTQGPEIFYHGERLGRNKKVFHIFKFRTLDTKKAAILTKDKTLPSNANIFTPLGQFLRDTRLDELPQIINIIRGDMNICGPRPVRSAIRDLHVESIPDYDIRFEVKPGLLGPTQAYFGHGTSKRIRARMNNATVRRKVSYKAEISLILRVISAMGARVVKKIFIDGLLCKVLPAKRNDLELVIDESGKSIPIQSITQESLSAEGLLGTSNNPFVIVRMRSGRIRRARIELGETDTKQGYSYKPCNDLSAYMIERYALNKVVVPASVKRTTIPKKVVQLQKASEHERVTI